MNTATATPLLDDLQAVRDLLTPPTRWVSEVYALNADGEMTSATSETATCWCLSGAISKVVGDDNARYARVVRVVRDSITDEEDNESWRLAEAKNTSEKPTAYSPDSRHIARFNDFLGHQAVLTLLDRSIASLA